MLMRGGTSKGAYFRRRDLPADPAQRDDLILRIVGSPDPRQIDGIGGAHVLTTKVAVVGPAAGPGADVDYLFLQPSVDEPLVSDAQNCGNMLAGVGPFAVERSMVAPGGAEARVRIHMVNTGSVATATFPLRDGMPDYSGPTSIDGVPGTAAAVRLDFEDIAGGSCGALLPTGSLVDSVEGVDCTLIDNGMPVVVMRAADVGVTGYEDCAALEDDAALRTRLEDVRMAAGRPEIGSCGAPTGLIPTCATCPTTATWWTCWPPSPPTTPTATGSWSTTRSASTTSPDPRRTRATGLGPVPGGGGYASLQGHCAPTTRARVPRGST